MDHDEIIYVIYVKLCTNYAVYIHSLIIHTEPDGCITKQSDKCKLVFLKGEGSNVLNLQFKTNALHKVHLTRLLRAEFITKPALINRHIFTLTGNGIAMCSSILRPARLELA